MKDNIIRVKGTIKEVLPNTRFAIVLDNKVQIEGYIGGKLRRYYIKILRGDRVLVEVSPYDLTKGRIIYRYKNKEDEERDFSKESDKNES